MKKNNTNPRTEKLKRQYIIHIALYAFIFNMLPLVAIALNQPGILVFLLLLGFPLACFVASLVFGIFNGYKWIYTIFPPLLFLPSVFIFYNFTALPYTLIYFLATNIGIGAGTYFAYAFSRKKKGDTNVKVKNKPKVETKIKRK
ncbi:MAG: hypothetical protein WDA24_00110 [Tissierellales bacterium]